MVRAYIARRFSIIPKKEKSLEQLGKLHLKGNDVEAVSR